MSNVNIAALWDSEVDGSGDKPFTEDHINTTYEYFSRKVRKEGGEMFIAKFSWWGEGSLEKAYTFRNGEWRKVESVDVDVVFDKYRFDDETVELKKELDEKMPVLNPFELEKLCKDKLLTYQRFSDYLARTYEAEEDTVEEILEGGKAVLKPRYDFGGKGIKMIDSLDEFEQREDLLVQRFIDSKEGIPSLGIEGVHDLRMIILDGEPQVAYVRQPDSGLISNVHQGGSMKKVSLEDVPDEVFEIVQEVDEEMSEYGDRLYSIDFIFDPDEEPWILELNSKPGLGFYEDEDIAEWKKPVIDRAASKLVDMGR